MVYGLEAEGFRLYVLGRKLLMVRPEDGKSESRNVLWVMSCESP